MPALTLDPALPKPGADSPPFLQTITLVDGQATIGRARWITNPDLAQGVAQIVELWVSPTHARKGLGRRLMDSLAQQARRYFEARNSRLRRLWMAVDQKNHIIARAFLMKFTFHHVGTVTELLKDQDLLVYMRTFD